MNFSFCKNLLSSISRYFLMNFNTFGQPNPRSSCRFFIIATNLSNLSNTNATISQTYDDPTYHIEDPFSFDLWTYNALLFNVKDMQDLKIPIHALPTMSI